MLITSIFVIEVTPLTEKEKRGLAYVILCVDDQLKDV